MVPIRLHAEQRARPGRPAVLCYAWKRGTRGRQVKQLRYLASAALLIAVYVLANRLGLFLQVSYGGLTPLWPAAGIAVALLWRGGLGWWPVVLVGEFLTALWLEQPWLAGINGGLAQLLEAGFAAVLLRRLLSTGDFTTTRDVFLFIGAGCLLPPLASACLGAAGLWQLGLIPQTELFNAWFTWWLGDAMGILVLTPALAVWSRWPFGSHRRLQSWLLLTALLIATGTLLLVYARGESEQLFFLLLPFMAFLAAYAGVAGASSAAVVMAALVLGMGLGQVPSEFTAAVRIAFVGASTFTGLLVAAAIAERRRSDRLLNSEQKRAATTLGSIGDGVICTNEAGLVTFLNPVAERMTGWPLDDAVGCGIEEVLPIEDTLRGGDTEHPVRRCLESAQPQSIGAHSRVTSRDGRVLAVEDSVAPILADDGGLLGCVVAFRDVTVERELRKRMRYQAEHDPVTGLVNRNAFDARLRELAATGAGEGVHALLYLDLDQFKLVNDSCGHQAGDRLLAELASVLSTLIEPLEIARLGGDEFGVLMPGMGEHAALELAESMRRTILDFRFQHGELVFTLGGSFGLTYFRGGEDTPDEVLSRADIACYMAKDAGRNRIHVYHAGDTETMVRHLAIQRLSQLQAAMDAGRFKLYGQRIERIDARHGKTPFYELLLRLQENGKLVGPGHFIPVAERFGLMPFIDRWVVEQAFRFLRRQDQESSDLHLSINLTGTTLDDESFFGFVKDLQERYGVDPRRIVFEVTESVAINRLTRAVDYMQRMGTLGYRFALDDFGAGVASFGYLQELPVDFVKLDGRFVRDLARNPASEVIIDALARLAHYRGIECIAEWVEDAESLDMLQRLGVELAQGFYLHRPQPLEQLLRLPETQ